MYETITQLLNMLKSMQHDPTELKVTPKLHDQRTLEAPKDKVPPGFPFRDCVRSYASRGVEYTQLVYQDFTY